jgi:hypothetical protein
MSTTPIEQQQSVSLQTGFDYSILDDDTRLTAQRRVGEIKDLTVRTAQCVIEIGTKLIEVKKMLGHGHFGQWLDAEFAWSKVTAVKFMQVAERFASVETIDFFSVSALYMLASPSTPISARDEAMTRAERGEPISNAKAHEIIRRHSPPTPSPKVERSSYTAQKTPPPRGGHLGGGHYQPTRAEAVESLSRSLSRKVSLVGVKCVLETIRCACGEADELEACKKCPLPRLILGIVGRAE